VLRHLERGHLTELIACVRMHGLPQADWVIARGLDRYGLELLVLTTDGVAAVRLGFPDGPVTSLRDVPASIRTALTCRCESARHRG
jgi:2-methylisocitrate lyase-like PEP mutase family enzyme